MDRDELRAGAGKLGRFQERFAGCFGRCETREHAARYVQGLLASDGRKNVARMVLQEVAEGQIPTGEVWSRQHFLTSSPWDARAVQREIQAVFAESLAPTAKAWSLGVVVAIDESAFLKHGDHSVGVQVQHCGCTGSRENCQVGVFLVGMTPGGECLLDQARLRVWAKRHREPGPPTWLMFQREIDHPHILRCWVSNAEESVSLETLAEVAGQRVRIEQFFEEAKGEVGMADYEARAWTSWHHHLSLVAVAHLFVTLWRLDLRPETPQLTLRQSFDLLRATLDRPRLSPDEALQLLEYHLQRNATATQSHRKSWLQKHQRLRKELTL